MSTNSTPRYLKVILIGLNATLARALAVYISGDGRLVVAGTEPRLSYHHVQRSLCWPDVALVDAAAFSAGSNEFSRQLRIRWPELKIICVAADAEAGAAMDLPSSVDGKIVATNYTKDLDALLAQLFPAQFMKVDYPRGSPIELCDTTAVSTDRQPCLKQMFA